LRIDKINIVIKSNNLFQSWRGIICKVIRYYLPAYLVIVKAGALEKMIKEKASNAVVMIDQGKIVVK